MKDSVPFVVVISGMACIFRVACEKEANNSEFIVLVMAFINCFALLFVLYLLIHNAYHIFEDKTKGYKIDQKKKDVEIKRIRIIVNVVIFIFLGVLGMGYMKVYSSVANDILSIVALGLSIISDDVSEYLSECLIAKGRKKLEKS